MEEGSSSTSFPKSSNMKKIKPKKQPKAKNRQTKKQYVRGNR